MSSRTSNIRILKTGNNIRLWIYHCNLPMHWMKYDCKTLWRWEYLKYCEMWNKSPREKVKNWENLFHRGGAFVCWTSISINPPHLNVPHHPKKSPFSTVFMPLMNLYVLVAITFPLCLFANLQISRALGRHREIWKSTKYLLMNTQVW